MVFGNSSRKSELGFKRAIPPLQGLALEPSCSQPRGKVRVDCNFPPMEHQQVPPSSLSRAEGKRALNWVCVLVISSKSW